MQDTGSFMKYPMLERNEDFQQWKMKITAVLMCKGVSDALDIVEAKELEKDVVQMAKGYILQGVAYQYQTKIVDCKTAKDMMNKLKEICVDSSSSTVTSLMYQFYSFRYVSGENLNEYRNRLLDLFRRTTAADGSISEGMAYTAFLYGLRASDDTSEEVKKWVDDVRTRASILKVKDLTVDKAFQLMEEVLNEQGVSVSIPLTGSEEGGSDNAYYAGSTRNKRTRNKQVKCFQCGKRGHYARDCSENREEGSEENANIASSDGFGASLY